MPLPDTVQVINAVLVIMVLVVYVQRCVAEVVRVVRVTGDEVVAAGTAGRSSRRSTDGDYTVGQTDAAVAARIQSSRPGDRSSPREGRSVLDNRPVQTSGPAS